MKGAPLSLGLVLPGLSEHSLAPAMQCNILILILADIPLLTSDKVNCDLMINILAS